VDVEPLAWDEAIGLTASDPAVLLDLLAQHAQPQARRATATD
jgi:hypothetical protein